MNKFMIIPLAIMIFMAVFTQALAFGEIVIVNGTLVDPIEFENLTANITEGGTPTEVGVEGYTIDVGFDYATGVIVLLISAVAVAIIAGITAVGSGLKEISVKIIFKTSIYLGIWALFSAFGLSGLTIIPLFGWMLYFLLTISYVIGVTGEIA